MVLLDRNEDEILQAVESGVLQWAWDIRAPGASRREIRIWRDSILEATTAQRRHSGDESPDLILREILPPRDLRSSELTRLWSCSSTHVHALIEAGCLIMVEAPAATSGPLSYCRVSRASVGQFLQARRVV